jgi:PHD/YefM family antitoxin component YafN of YafNO toxin-antitoxin module
MLDVSQDIRSLTDFKTNTTEFLSLLRKKRRAFVLTVNGRAEVAVMGAATFQRVLEALDTLDSLRALKEGLGDKAAGRTRPAGEFLADVRRKKGLPKRSQ